MRSVHGFPLSLVALSLLASTTDAQVDDRLKLEDCVVPGTQIQARCGRYTFHCLIKILIKRVAAVGGHHHRIALRHIDHGFIQGLLTTKAVCFNIVTNKYAGYVFIQI